MSPAADGSGNGSGARSAAGRPLQAARGAVQAVATGGRYLAQSLRLMVGLPDYDAYLTHRERTHPGEPVMSYAEFFRERQDARYGGNGRIGRCC
ncbi:YbdD/YjiX family protein [Paracidovorax citrulli]|nr:YbdD/YjiX family protein [Paracidovorax citrulli]UMT89869.1 YbdD/YjiX family protein [Paracidovorax citrulli]WIY35346.1 YbdD/YjiX family protein [Paracidovorax citrulli]SDJ03765.1 Uncharacterized short protein YbdD, DUF466 family [Paracidovorax citrulli]